MLRAKISKGGKVSIPSSYRKKLQLKDGEEILFGLQGDDIIISSLHYALKKSRKILNKYLNSNESLADELIAERREAAKHE